VQIDQHARMPSPNHFLVQSFGPRDELVEAVGHRRVTRKTPLNDMPIVSQGVIGDGARHGQHTTLVSMLTQVSLDAPSAGTAGILKLVALVCYDQIRLILIKEFC
jgi:hypothetical protein